MYMMYESGAKPIVFVLYCAFKKEMGRGQWLNVEQIKTYIKWLTVEDLFINLKKKIISKRRDVILWNVDKSKSLILCRTNKRRTNVGRKKMLDTGDAIDINLTCL